MDDWKKFNEVTLPDKGDFYSYVNMEKITDADAQTQKGVSENFGIKNLEKYCNLYLKGNT